MTFVDSIQTCFQKYFTFSGRAIRSEFWFFALFCLLGSIIAQALDEFSLLGNLGLLDGLFSLATLIPSIAVGARRLHDTNRSGWWQLLGFIPIIGWIILIIWFASAGNEAENRFGPDPLEDKRPAPAGMHRSNIPTVSRED